MKLNKIFLGLVGLAAMTLASCSSSDDYEWAKVSGPQVFFSDALPSQYEIDPEATSFDVPISRADASGSLTVNLTATSENPMYTVPASVTFADGQKEASIPVTYDPTAIEYGRYDNITISVSDAANGTPWGIQEFSFKAGVTDWGAWQKWNSAGTADYTYTIYWDGVDPDLPFVYRHNLIKPNLYQFKLSNWGSGVDVVWDYDEETGIVSVAPQFVTDNASYGAVTVADYCYYQTVVRETPTTKPTGYFDKEQGILACPVSYYVSAGSFGSDYEYIYIDGYVRADYTHTLSYAGIFTDANNGTFAVGNLTGGADVTTAKAVVMDASVDADAVADAIAAGDLEATDVEPGLIYVPIPEGLTGALQLITVVVVDGQVKSTGSAEFEYFGGGANPWKTLGEGYFVDDVILPLFGYEAEPYPVVIEESTETPGVYRLKDMYSVLAAEFGETGGKGDIIVNADHADGVYILPQDLQLTIGSNGPFGIATDAGELVAEYGYDAVKAEHPQIFGKLENKTITFPTLEEENSNNEKVQYQLWALLDGKHYFAGTTGSFQIVLPGAEAASVAKRAARAAHFAKRLSGKFIPVEKSNRKQLRKMLPLK